MGYNYKTTDLQDTDFIYQSPVNFMMQAIQTADAANDQQIQQADLLGNAVAKVNYLPTDEAAVKALQDSYNKQINDVTNQIMQDPANYRKHLPVIKNVTRDLSQNLATGELASYMNKANALAEWDKNNHSKVVGSNGKPGTVSPEAYKLARAKFLNDYANSVKEAGGRSYNSSTKTAIPFNTEDLIDTPDINKAVSEATDKIKANSTDWKKDTTTGQWIFTNSGKNESVERARVAQIARDAIVGDPEMMGYFKQGTKLGYLKGAYDAEGKFIEPYTTNAKGELTWNPSSALAAPIRSAVGRDAYTKVETEQSMKDNPYGLKSFSSALDLGNQQKMAVLKNQLDDTSKAKADALKLAHDKDMLVWRTAAGNGVSLQSVIDKLAGGTSKTVLTASPDGVTTISPFAGNGILSTDKVNKALIPDTQNQIADLLAKTKDPTLTDNQRAIFQQQLDQQQALADQYQQWSDLAHDASIKKLDGKVSSKDLAGYYNYVGNANGMRDKLNTAISTIDQKLQSLANPEYLKQMNTLNGAKNGVHGVPAYTNPQVAKALLEQRQVVTSQIHKYGDIGDKIKSGADEWFKNNSKATNISLKGVGLDPTGKQLIFDKIKLDPNSIQIHNLNTDASSSANDIKSMIDDVVKKGEKLSDYFDIERVNSPAPGIGVTASIKLNKEGVSRAKRFFSLDNRELPTTMLMTLPSDVLNVIGNNMKANGKSETEKNVGSLITNQSKSSLLSSLSNRIMSTDGSEQPIGVSTLYDPASRQNVKITAVPNMAEGTNTAQSVKIYVTNNVGKPVLFTTPQNPTGEWASTKAAVDAMIP